MSNRIDSIFCNNCAATTMADAKFCRKCGCIPTTTISAKEFVEATKDIVILNNKLGALHSRLMQPINVDNVWNQFFMSLSSLLSIYLFRIKILNNEIAAYQTDIKKSNPTIDDSSVFSMMQTFEIEARRSFLLEWLFLFESNIADVLEKYLDKIPSSSYHENLKMLLQELQIITTSDSKSEIFDTLYFPYVIRNTLHQNGLCKKGKILCTKGYNFVLVKNKFHKLGTWRHTLFFMGSMLDSIERVFDHPNFDDTRNPNVL